MPGMRMFNHGGTASVPSYIVLPHYSPEYRNTEPLRKGMAHGTDGQKRWNRFFPLPASVPDGMHIPSAKPAGTRCRKEGAHSPSGNYRIGFFGMYFEPPGCTTAASRK